MSCVLPRHDMFAVADASPTKCCLKQPNGKLYICSTVDNTFHAFRMVADGSLNQAIYLYGEAGISSPIDLFLRRRGAPPVPVNWSLTPISFVCVWGFLFKATLSFNAIVRSLHFLFPEFMSCVLPRHDMFAVTDASPTKCCLKQPRPLSKNQVEVNICRKRT
jgi:hypothetical protein